MTKAMDSWSAEVCVPDDAPGLIQTEMIHDAPVQKIKGMIPMARLGAAEEVAKVVRFLCSADASYVTGQVLSVNGGMF